jgi:hypothetical protein
MKQPFLVIAMMAAVAMPSGSALAQRNGNYQVTQMNFDLWCQEQAGLPVERCDKRDPQDIATFEAYRAKVEAYEIPYLQRKNSAARLDRDILALSGLTTVIFPERNAPDLNEVPLSVREQMQFHPVGSVDELLALALEAEPLAMVA